MYYLRNRKGKSARISEKIKKKIGIDVYEKVVENKPTLEMNKEELKKENPTKDTVLKAEQKKEELKTKKK